MVGKIWPDKFCKCPLLPYCWLTLNICVYTVYKRVLPQCFPYCLIKKKRICFHDKKLSFTSQTCRAIFSQLLYYWPKFTFSYHSGYPVSCGREIWDFWVSLAMCWSHFLLSTRDDGWKKKCKMLNGPVPYSFPDRHVTIISQFQTSVSVSEHFEQLILTQQFKLLLLACHSK